MKKIKDYLFASVLLNYRAPNLIYIIIYCLATLPYFPSWISMVVPYNAMPFRCTVALCKMGVQK